MIIRQLKQLVIELYQICKYSITFLKRRSFRILTSDETIDYIVNNRCSLARFGDGEFKLAKSSLSLNKNDLGFQQYDESLAKRLYAILTEFTPEVMVGLPSPIFGIGLGKMTSYARQHWKNQCLNNIEWLYSCVYRKQLFLDSFFTRFYIDYKDHSHCPEYVKQLKRIWNDRRLIIVEGALTRLGIGNDLFDNAASIQRIICPARDAYDKIDEIEKNIKEVVDCRNSLVLVALGPTATVIAVDMAKLGIQTIDIGHIDIEYEWMRRRAINKIPIPGKYVNEARSNNAFDPIYSENYENQIVKIVE